MTTSNGSSDGAVDAKGSIARRILDALIHDNLIQLALDAHADESKRRNITEGASTSESEREEGEVETSYTTNKAATTPGANPEVLQNTNNGGGDGSRFTGGSSATVNLLTSTYSSNPLIRCVLCNRHVASNRYAPHLAKCMGLGNAGGSKNATGGLKRKAAAAAAAAAANGGGGSGAGTPTPSGSGSIIGERGGGGKGRGRPLKHGGTKDHHGSLSAGSTPGYGGKEGSAAL